MAMITQTFLYLDNMVNRDKYLSGITRRIDYFKDRRSSVAKRVIDDLDEIAPEKVYFVPEVDAAVRNIGILKQSIRERGRLIARNTDTGWIDRKLAQPLVKNKSFLTAQIPILTEKLLNLFDRKRQKDLLSKYFENAFAKGTGVLDWTIAHQAIVDHFGESAIVTPTFRKGDLFFFDHLLVHRTQCVPNFAEKRYAIENWFFDSVNFPKSQIPMKW